MAPPSRPNRGRPGGRLPAVLLLVVGAGWASLACAASQPAVSAEDYAVPVLTPAPSPGGWEVSATPYIWAPGLKGDAGVSTRLPVVGLDLSSGDILDMLTFGLMGRAEARHDRFVATADGLYVDLKATQGIRPRDREFGQATLKTQLFIATVLAGSRIVDRGAVSVDLLGGLRVVDLDLDLAVSGPRRTLTGHTGDTWIDPIVAARAHGPLGGRWSYSAYGDIGGFGVASSLTWQLAGTVDYQAGANWTLSAGWRHLDIDYGQAGFLYDAALDGPILSAGYRF